MRIAQVAPLMETVPPNGYGGTERVVANLCDALVDLGHEVTLFAAGGSRTKARLEAIRHCALRSDRSVARHDLAAHINMLGQVRDSVSEYDIIHFHTDVLQFAMFQGCSAAVVTTLHTQLNQNDARKLLVRWPEHPVIFLSNSHRKAMPEGNWAGTVYNGLPLDRFSLRDCSDGYLAFLGRFSPDKGAHVAIATAKRLGRKLLIAARIDAHNISYFDKEIRPHLEHPLIDYVGEISEDQKQDFLGGADALLFPISWPEPFGLVMIEAMACGTPVVALAAGAVPEVISEGVSGVVVETEDQLDNAVIRALSLRRTLVRRSFEQRFSAPTMATAYVRIFENLIKKSRSSRDDPQARPASLTC